MNLSSEAEKRCCQFFFHGLHPLAAIFQNGRPKSRFFNISAPSSLRIVILVSKHAYIRARIPIELITNTYLHEFVSHFPKWPTKRDFQLPQLTVRLGS